MLTLRPYQKDCREAILDFFRREKEGNPVAALPTGTGKSVCIADLIHFALTRWPKQRILALTHVKELIAQNYSTLLKHWPTAPAGIYSAGLKQREAHFPVVFGGIASVVKKAELLGRRDLVIIDEAHLLSEKETTGYAKLLAGLREINPRLRVVGFTATPYRMGSGRITDGKIFTELCFDLTHREAFNKLIADGHLALLVPKRTDLGLDVEKVSTRRGDYDAAELAAAVDISEVTKKAVLELVESGQDRAHWLVFAAGVEHAKHVAEAIRAHGVTCEAVFAAMGDENRDKALSGFKAGHIRCLVNNNVLTTGFDMPGIDLIGMLRPTRSPGLWVQMLGRGTRPAPGKANCLVLDFARNTSRLGPINDPVIPKAGRGGNGTAPVRLCKECDCYSHARATVCVSCGAEFEVVEKLVAAASELELVTGFERAEPVVEDFDVAHAHYKRHKKAGAPDSMRVTYFAGLRSFSEWICFEHSGFAGKKARDWWRMRSEEDAPNTVDDALELAGYLPVPSQIKVRVDKKFPEILGYTFGEVAKTNIDANDEVEDIPF